MSDLYEPDYEKWDMENRIDELVDERDHWCDLHTVASRDRRELYVALDMLYAIVGLTAFKHENQRAVLQEAMNNASMVLCKTKEERSCK